MKTLKILVIALVAFAATPNYAALDIFLKIEGNGFNKIVPLGCKDGTCKKGVSKIEGFKAGTYTFSIVNEYGEPMRLETKPMRRSGMVILTTQITTPQYADAVIAKEMGTPATRDTLCKDCFIQKRIEKELPAGAAFSEVIEIKNDGVLLVDFSGVWADGGIMFTDDWETVVN